MIQALYENLQKINVDCQIVENVKFSLKEKKRAKHTGFRNVLVVSLSNLEASTEMRLHEVFHRHRLNCVSFPIKEKSKHLMVRFKKNIFNFGYFPTPWFSKFRVWPSKLPRQDTIETLVPLDAEEMEKMSSYIANIERRKRRTLGSFDNEGCQQTVGALSDNRTTARGHNCTSWVATAPVGANGEALMELLGAQRELNVGTNPGWWSA